MAEVIIQLSQATVDHLAALDRDGTGLSLAATFDAFAAARAALTRIQGAALDVGLGASQGTVYYPSGASATYSGLSSSNGALSATSVDFVAPAYLALHYAGALQLRYSPGTDGPALTEAGARISSGALQTLLPQASELYPQELGNVALAFQGDLTLSEQGDFRGRLTWLEARAEKFVTHSTLSGDFTVAGNDGAAPQVSGILHGYSAHYEDGSAVDLHDVAVAIGNAASSDAQWLQDGAQFGGADHFDLDLPARLDTPWVVASGAGDDYVRLTGGGGQLSARLGDGNDVVTLGDIGHRVDGGAGIDTAGFYCDHTQFGIDIAGNTVTLHAADGDNVLTNVERLRFSDENIALDIDGAAGQAYRIYQAAFDRAPDLAGLGYWIHRLDQGLSLTDIAAGFVASQEFQQLYGAAPSADELAARMYANVLHRVPDPAGLAFWTHILDAHAATTAQVLAAVAESAENQAGVAALIGQGIAYLPVAE